ncbi:Sulfotransferase domain [Macleaya cordata]|uniref:Sulfotransferase n=1 Tax=Macleaya cordata TaxID=56857 RepID=A0A200QU12_MACCD|nr:Sulfotransferase domain [Macleaya cordata]
MDSSEVKNFLEEGESLVSQETKDLLSSLPREEGCAVDYIYQFQGFWFTEVHLQGVLTCQRQFKAHDNDLLLVTNPKSGTTWLKAMAFAIVNRRFYSSTTKNHPLLTNNPHELVPLLEEVYVLDHVELDLTCTAGGFVQSSSRLFSTHMPYLFLPQICQGQLTPKDTLISLWHFMNKLRPKNLEPNSLEEVFELYCKGAVGYGPFWDHVLGYWKESLERPEMVCFLKFEDMKKEPKLHLKRLAEFLGHPFSLEEETQGVVDEIVRLCSFENMSNLEVNKTGKMATTGLEKNAYFRKSKVGDYVNYLTSEMIERLDQIIKEKFHGSSLNF